MDTSSMPHAIISAYAISCFTITMPAYVTAIGSAIGFRRRHLRLSIVFWLLCSFSFHAAAYWMPFSFINIALMLYADYVIISD